MSKETTFSKEHIIFNALLIAKYEGFETYESNGYKMIRYAEDNERTAQDTAYHLQWEWLLPIAKMVKEHEDFNAEDELFDDILNNDIQATYRRVCSFLQHQDTEKKLSSKFEEVKADYKDEKGVIHIDGYLKELDEDDNGRVIGYFIHGEVYWKRDEYMHDPLVVDVVKRLEKNHKKNLVG